MNNVMFGAMMVSIWEILVALLVLLVMAGVVAGAIVLVVWLMRRGKSAPPVAPPIRQQEHIGAGAGETRRFSFAEIRAGQTHVRWVPYGLGLVAVILGSGALNGLLLAAGVWSGVDTVLFGTLAGVVAFNLYVIYQFNRLGRSGEENSIASRNAPQSEPLRSTSSATRRKGRKFTFVEEPSGEVRVRWRVCCISALGGTLAAALAIELFHALGGWKSERTLLTAIFCGVGSVCGWVIYEWSQARKAQRMRSAGTFPTGTESARPHPGPLPQGEGESSAAKGVSMGRSAEQAPGSCPRCGAAVPAEAPQGLCPRCVLGVGLATQTEATGESGPHGTKVVQAPPEPAEIAKHFPQLEILECLGRGGMGVVYKARQPKLNRLVALKILAPEKGADPKFAERFLREAQALARLNHPNIVTVHDFGEAEGLYYLLMEYVDGMTLRQLLQGQKLTPEEALNIVPKICEALQFAHELGVVHRDIKPENVLVDRQGRVKIADFGIAKIVAADQPRQAITQDQVVGTPHYMAPEQVEKPQLVDHRADIYSLGVVFYEMLTGELPLGKFQPPSKKVQVDVRLDEVVLHALEKEPERRYQRASEVKTAVETIAATPGAPAAGRGLPAAGGPGAGPPVVIKRWRDAWIWNWEYIQLFLIVPLVVVGLALPVLVPRMGLKALWLIAAELGGIAFAITYAIVGRQVRRARAEVPRTERDVAECLMFRRPFQSPGVAVMHEDRLELIPIVGSPIIVPLADIVAIKEVKWFNGTRLWLKKGFVMDLATGQRVGVAVAEVFARRWRAKLSRGALPETPQDDVRTRRMAGSGKPAGWVTGMRWSARILGTLLFAIYMLFLVGEGLPPMGSQPEGVQLGFLANAVILLGFLVGWKREGAAALLILSGCTFWHIIQGRIGLNAFLTPLPVGILYGLCWWATQGRRTLAAAGTIALLAVALALGGYFAPTNVFLIGTTRDAATGAPIAKAELTLQPHRPSAAAKDKGPNARSDKTGKFYLYVGWYAPEKQVSISAPGYETLTANLGPRALGQRKVSRDYQLRRADSATSGESESAGRRFVRMVVDKDAMTFEGQPTTWETVGGLLERVPHRAKTVLECAVTSDQITVQQQNEWFGKCSGLAQEHGFAYASFVGVHALGSRGTGGAAAGHVTGAPARFGPVIERVVNDDSVQRDLAIDFDSGKLFSPPPGLTPADTNAFLAWVRGNGIDAIGETSQSIRGLAGLEMVARPVNAELWKALTPRAALTDDVLKHGTPGSPVFLSAKGALPETYLFRTREGGIGLVQITGFSGEPRGVEIRYKLVESGGLSESPPADREGDFVAEHRAELGQKALDAAREFVEEHKWKMRSEFGDQARVVLRATDAAGKQIMFEEAAMEDGTARFTIIAEPGAELSAQRIGAAIWRRLGWVHESPGVAAQPTPPPVARAEAGMYQITLANGITVEVVAVARDPLRSWLWWKPDGTPLPQPPGEAVEFQPAGMWTRKSVGSNDCAILVRHGGRLPSKWQGGRQYTPRGEFIGHFGVKGVGMAEVIRFPAGTKEAAMHVATAADRPWEAVAVFDGSRTRVLIEGIQVLCTHLRHDPDGKCLDVSHNVDRGQYALRMMARFKSGKREEVGLHSGVLSAQETQGYVFLDPSEPDLRAGDIAEFVLERTPWVSGEIGGIALAPRTATTLKPLSFGPAIERELGGWPSLDCTVLDLDQGRLLVVPTNIVAGSMNNPRPLLHWMVERGADLTVQMGAGPALHLDDGVLLRLEGGATFESVAASTVRRQLAGGGGAQDVSIPRTEVQAQPVFVYRTREGGMGVLQVLGPSQNRFNLRIRFKAALPLR